MYTRIADLERKVAILENRKNCSQNNRRNWNSDVIRSENSNLKLMNKNRQLENNGLRLTIEAISLGRKLRRVESQV
jgi:hypothetical protein